jgi:ABC-type glycerol-3-phosphate transport system substrate-binding protein
LRINRYTNGRRSRLLVQLGALCLAGLFSLSGCKERFSPHVAPEADAERWVSETLDNPNVQANVALPSGAAGKIAISVNNFPPGDQPLEQDVVAQEIEMFERKNPGVRVDYSTWTFSPESFFERAKNGTLTDIVEVSASQMTPIMDLNYAADITELTQRTAEMAMINPEVLNFMIRQGRLYGVPTELHTMALFYNKRLFDEAINPPPPPPEEKKKEPDKKEGEEEGGKKKPDTKKKKPQQPRRRILSTRFSGRR